MAGQQIVATTATPGQVIDSSGAVVAGGGLPVTGQVRLVAVNLAPAFFTTVTVDGNEMREYVEHLPAETQVSSGTLDLRRSSADRDTAQRELGAEDAGAAARRRRVHRRPARGGAWLAGGAHSARPAELADRHRGGPGRDDRRLAPALARRPRRAGPAAPHLQPPARGARVLAPGPEPARARRLARAAHAADQPADQPRGDPARRRAERRGPLGPRRRRAGPATGADRPRGRPRRAGAR